MAKWIANRFHDRVAIEEAEVGDEPVLAVAAASIYMASHLLGDARSLELVSSCDGVGVEAARRAYSLIHVYRSVLISTELLERAGMELDGVDEVLPSVMA